MNDAKDMDNAESQGTKSTARKSVSFADDTIQQPELDGDAQSGNMEDGDDTGILELTIKLPHFPHSTDIHVSSSEQVQDLRQSIIDLPSTMQYTCFHLEHKGKRINDFIELSEVDGLKSGSELELVEDPYTEKDARLHFVRMRELVGAAGDRTDTTHGILSGVSLHDEVTSSVKTEPSVVSTAAAYQFSSEGSSAVAVPKAPEPQPKTVKSIFVSPWNPPPYHLRMKGHLLYLQLTTNEGEQFHITSHTSGFYVNRSTKDKFDPSPKSGAKDMSAHSLLTLLSKLSPLFERAFEALSTENSKKDPLTLFTLQNAIPASPWLVPSPSSSGAVHQADLTRSQESYLFSGAENQDSLRDWNEEFQSTRELPKDQMQERVFRERLTSKLFADFSEAAARGAVLVARGDILALNPTESRDSQIFVYNNIFFSFGADGMGTFAADGGDEAARVATGKDVFGVKAVNQLDISGLFTPGTVIVDYLGKRIVAQSIVPGIFKQREPGEHQVDYGGVDGKEIVADNEAFVPLFEQLSKQMHVKKHPVWDKFEKRHDMEASVETKGLLGTDGRKYVLDLYRVTPLDVAWLEQYWSEPSKDETAKDATKNYMHRMAVLRPQLVSAYARMKLGEFVSQKLKEQSAASAEADKTTLQTKDSTGEATNGEVAESQEEQGTAEQEKKPIAQVDATDFSFALNPDVFCGQVPQTAEEKADLEADEAQVRAVCEFLTSKVIPGLVHDLQEGEVGFPVDGLSLSRLLHKRGINIRYLGRIAKLADDENQRLLALRTLARREMVSRAFKHIANKHLKTLPPPAAAACLAHLLNCLLGSGFNAKPIAETDELTKSIYTETDFSYESVTPTSLRQDIVAQIKMRYQYDLGEEEVVPGQQLQLLREVSLKLGLQLEGKQYLFESGNEQVNGVNGINGSNGINGNHASAEPQANGTAKKASKKKKKASDNSSPARQAQESAVQNVTFHPDNILNIVPVVKEAAPISSLAEDALEAGRISIHQGDRQRGQTLLLETLSLYEQIYGILHPEVAGAYSQLSTLYYSLDEKAAAVELARKALIVSERTSGVDSSTTILCYLSLALSEHASGNGKLALRYVLHALDLLKVVYGPDHPDSITTINNGAVMLQQLRKYPESRAWFEGSLALSIQMTGKSSTGTATLLFQLSQALALDGDSRSAVNKMRETHAIFKDKLGSDSPNTKDAAIWLERLTQNAVVQAKREKVLAELPVSRLRVAKGLPGKNIAAPLERSAAPASGVTANVSGTGKRELDDRNIEELIKYIEGGDTKKSSKTEKKANPKRRVGRAA